MDNSKVVNENNDSKKILTIFVLIMTLMICTTGATYAYFAINATNDNSITGNAATASLVLNVTKATLGGTNSGTTKTNKLVPQNYSALGTAMGNNYKCIDGNGNDVCHVYTITVTNTSTARIKLNGTISFTGTADKYVNLQWTKSTSLTSGPSNAVNACVSSDDPNTTNYDSDSVCSSFPTYDLVAATPGAECSISNGTCTDTTTLAAGNGSITYYVVVWINEISKAQYDTGTYKAVVTFSGENGTGVTSTITS